MTILMTPTEKRIALLWSAGHDTYRISRLLCLPQSEVYNMKPYELAKLYGALSLKVAR